MTTALLGATGLIGSAFLRRSLAHGARVRALIRDARTVVAHELLEVVVGDANDADVVARLVSGADAVVSALGPRANTRAAVDLLDQVARNVIAGMEASGVRRVVFVAGAGLALPGERRTLSQRVASGLVRRLARWVVAAKQRELDLYMRSALEWTALRPPRVVAGASSGRARLLLDGPRGFVVTSGDLADAIALALDDPRTIRRAPYVGR
jgi:putative NADH-flavin reductase